MRTRSLANMLQDVRQRTNQENSTFVTDAEITEYLNVELAELWGRLVLNQGQPHFRSQTAIHVVANVALYALPADFWTLQGVEATYGGITRPMVPFMPSEHAELASALKVEPFTLARYRIQANNIEFLPSNNAFDATVFYTPACPRLVNPSDLFDGFNGYEVAAIYGACATVLAKEESDPSFYVGQRERIYQQIDRLSAHRDMANPERVQDVRDRRLAFPFGWIP